MGNFVVYHPVSSRKKLPNSTFFSLPDNGVGGVSSENTSHHARLPRLGLPGFSTFCSSTSVYELEEIPGRHDPESSHYQLFR